MPANYVLLERIELNASAASITFSNIPQTGYTDLKIVMSMRSADVSNVAFECSLTFNGNTTGYTAKQLYGDGSTAASSSPTVRPAGFIVGTSATASTFSNGELYIPNYTSSNYKSYSVDSVTETNATTQYMNLLAGLWSNTAAITSIALAGTSGSFAANSTFSLYGLAAVGSTPAIAPKASGGNITTDGTYWYHTFLASGTFTPQVALSADVLVVAGGGGGGGTGVGGGGGAGGLLGFTSQSLTATAYTCTVGAGGAGGTTGYGVDGNSSIFGALTTAVGGGGGVTGTVGNNGGSGGGGGIGGYAGGTATSGQGYNGGAGFSSTSGTTRGAGGGGGSGAVGTNGSSGTGGTGGIGVSTYSSWASATSTGVSNYYAAGGGGGSSAGSGTYAGGTGGGGTGSGSGSVAGTAATTNTGSGGGGGGTTSGVGNSAGGAGGSGIVIVRYAI